MPLALFANCLRVCAARESGATHGLRPRMEHTQTVREQRDASALSARGTAIAQSHLVQRLAANPAADVGNRRFEWADWLPTEHGFWVMLSAAQGSALLRTRGTSASLLAAAFVLAVLVIAGGFRHRRIRKSSAAQLSGTAALALSSVPIELAGALPGSSIASA